MDYYERNWEPEGCAKKKIAVVRKILIQLQDLLQIVECKSTKYEENRRIINQLEKIFEDLKKDLNEKEERLSESIEKIWTGIEETAVCLKGLEEVINGKNKENSENDVYLPCYSSLDSIISEHYRRKYRRWKRLKSKLEELASKAEEIIPYEIGRQWEVIACNFESEDDENKRVSEPLPLEIRDKRQKLQVQDVQSKENVSKNVQDAEDDENFAKFLEQEAKRLRKKKRCKMVLKKTSAVDSNPKPLVSSQTKEIQALAPSSVLQELSLNREPTVEPSRPVESLPSSVPNEPSHEVVLPSNVKPYCGPAYHAFEEMGLAESLVSGINLWGLSVPYALEKIAIPAFLSGIDMIVEGPLCTGKTTSASIGALNKLNTNLKKLQAIFLVPTDDVAELVMRYISDLGTLLDVQLSSNVGSSEMQSSQIFFGTPVTVNNLISSRRLSTDFVKMLVVDSAEELTADSHQPILQVLYSLPGSTQFIMLTRQLTAEVSCLSSKMRSPVHVNCSNESILSIVPLNDSPDVTIVEPPSVVEIQEIENGAPRLPGIDFDNMNQFYVVVETDELKIKVLAALTETMEIEQAIIFCNSGQKADWLARKIREKEKGLEVCSVHAGRENWDHLITLFEAGVSRVLITTDFITKSNFRVKPVSLVLNYEFPEIPDNYTKRITCAGRSRRSNSVIGSDMESAVLVFTFVTSENLPQLENLSRKYEFRIAPMSSQPT